MTTGRLSIVIVTEARPHAPAYHAYSSLLVERAVRAAERSGWSVDLIAAQDAGAPAVLAHTDRSDALVILGGEDIAPEFYGAARGYRLEGSHAERADEAQIAVARRAVDRGTPLLGICRGHQIINVALGGGLLQDVGEQSTHRRDDVPIERVMSTHDVQTVAGTRLAEAFGAVVSTQSAHHQAVETLGRGLRVAATADDGLVEAIEHATAPVLGVQWHPEDLRAPEGQFEALLRTVTAHESALRRAA